MQHSPPPADDAPRRSSGRPSRDDAARRDERVMEVAAGLFIHRGFDLASMDALAEAAGVSKATLYARFGDKRQLFITVIRGEIARWLAPLSAIVDQVVEAGGGVAAAPTLLNLGRQLTRSSLEPRVVALGRVISMQAAVFPELAELAHEEGWLRAVAAVARLLERFAERGEIAVPEPEIAADLLLNLILGRSMRRAAYGVEVDTAVAEQRLQAAISLFLHGTSRGADARGSNGDHA